MRPTKYFARDLLTKNAEAVELSVQTLEAGHYAVTLRGVRHQIDVVALPNGSVSMLVDGQSFAADFEAKRDEVAVLLRSQVSRFDIADEAAWRVRAVTAAFTAEGKQTILAPMPGKVVKVLVKVGDAVTEGQGLVVVEAMKMENELKSPKAGVVVELTAKEGVAVENGAKLAVIE